MLLFTKRLNKLNKPKLGNFLPSMATNRRTQKSRHGTCPTLCGETCIGPKGPLWRVLCSCHKYKLMTLIITRGGKGATKIDPSDFEKEHDIQSYIHENPESVPLYDIKQDIRLLIVAREFSTDSGPIDALGFDLDGSIYLIETKLFRNADKRLVVAQVLDYGASLWHSYADFSDFTTALEASVQEKFKVSLNQRLKDFFGLDDEGVATLLESVRRNLHEGNFRFVVLMDKLHDRLKDLIVFLNQNSKFDIFAVELEYYKYEDYEIMIPKLFGAEVKKDVGISSSGPRHQWDEASFFEDAKQKNDKPTNDVLADLYEFSKQNADSIEWGTGQHKGSFTFKLNHPDSKSGVISLIDLRSNGRIIFRFGNLTKRLGKGIASKFFDALSPLPFIQRWDKGDASENDWGVGGPISEVLPDGKAVQMLKSAIVKFKSEVKK